MTGRVLVNKGHRLVNDGSHLLAYGSPWAAHIPRFLVALGKLCLDEGHKKTAYPLLVLIQSLLDGVDDLVDVAMCLHQG